MEVETKGDKKGRGAMNQLTADAMTQGTSALSSSSVVTGSGAAPAQGGHIQMITTNASGAGQRAGRQLHLCSDRCKDPRRSRERRPDHDVTDTCTDEHVCGLKNFNWVPLAKSRNPGTPLADGSPLTHQRVRLHPRTSDTTSRSDRVRARDVSARRLVARHVVGGSWRAGWEPCEV